MGRRRFADRAELGAHLEWLRCAIHDRHVDVRLVLEGLLDAVVMVAEDPPGPPGPRPGNDVDGEEAGVVLQ